MSRIDDLIRERCPDGVKYLRVGDIATVGTGSSDRKDAVPAGEYPFYVRSREVMRKDEFEFDEEAVVIPGEGGIGDIFHFVTGRYALHQRAYRVNFQVDELLPKFGYYCFVVGFKTFISSRAVNATVTSIRKPMIEDFRIPVPPLEVQREVVGILDSFAELETELEAELEARKTQYDYYRDSLLAFSDATGVWRVPMGELCRVLNGYAFKSGLFNSNGDGTPLIRIRDINTGFSETYFSGEFDDRYVVKNGDIVIGMDGDFKAVRWSHGRALLNQRVCKLHDFADIVVPDFLFYVVRIAIAKIQVSTQASTVKHLSSRQLEAIPIPIPARKVQERVVELLDKFDALVSDVSVGIPAELVARRKQHEYYRDRLLTFEEAAV